MSSIDNKFRKKWQDYSGKNSNKAELDFYDVFNIIFENTQYKISRHPKNFNNIYKNVQLDSKEQKAIYNPDKEIKKHGIIPDFVIYNVISKKSIYIEIKRQDGWVEGKDRSAGRGNAHERLCKYFSPGILELLKSETKIKEDLPFWAVFIGDITRDPCRVREIKFWFNKYENNYFFWRDISDAEPLIEHFEKNIAPILD